MAMEVPNNLLPTSSQSSIVTLAKQNYSGTIRCFWNEVCEDADYGSRGFRRGRETSWCWIMNRMRRSGEEVVAKEGEELSPTERLVKGAALAGAWRIRRRIRRIRLSRTVLKPIRL